jgi:hypothetical protein
LAGRVYGRASPLAMPYLYQSNLDLYDRADQLAIQMDSGGTALLRLGHVYDLTAGELARARQGSGSTLQAKSVAEYTPEFTFRYMGGPE